MPKSFWRKEAGTAAEIAYQVGFNSPTYFNTCFHEYYGYPPGEISKRKDQEVSVSTNDGSFVEQLVNTPKEERWNKEFWDKGDRPKKRRSLTYAIFAGVVILLTILLAWKAIQNGPKTDKERSIAVMPFINASMDEGNQYFVDGMMEDIRNSLSRIAGLRVISRTSTMKYHESNQTVSQIAKELEVNYLLEGMVQKQGFQVKIHVQLIDPVDDIHIWAETYNINISEVNQVFNIQSDVALKIANELYINISPEVSERINSIPTTELTAYEYYLRAKHHKDAEQSSKFYLQAIEIDPTFAEAYCGLARAYIQQSYMKTYFEKDFLDSALELANIAISYNESLAEGYLIRANYYLNRGDIDKALQELNKVLIIDPNNPDAYGSRSNLRMVKGDWVGALNDHMNALTRNRDESYTGFLTFFAFKLGLVGFPELTIPYLEKSFNLHQDSGIYYFWRAQHAFEFYRDMETAIYFARKDNNKTLVSKYLALNGQYHEAYPVYKEIVENLEESPFLYLQNAYRFGFCYWMVEKREEAMKFFNMQIEASSRIIENERRLSSNKYAYYDLAATYAFLGQKELAYSNLEIFCKTENPEFNMLVFLKNEPMFDSLKNEERFQALIKIYEDNFQAKHIEVKEWLEEIDFFE